MDLALNNLQRLICHKTKPIKPSIFRRVNHQPLRPTCFNASWTSHSVTTPLQLAASAAPMRGSRQDSCETPEAGDQDSGQSDHESAPERHLATRSQQSPIRGLDRIDIPIGKPSHFFTRSCVRFHSFVENCL